MLVGRRFIAGTAVARRRVRPAERALRAACSGSRGASTTATRPGSSCRARPSISRRVRFFLGYGLIFFGQHILTVVATTAILFVYDWQLALIALAITPILVAIAYLYSRASHPILKDVQQKLADMTTVAEENIVGVNVVKAFAQEDREEREVRARGTRRSSTQSIKATRQRAFYVPVLSFLPLLAQAGVLLAGGHRVVNGELSIGAFVAFNVYVLMLIMPLRMLGMWIGMFQRAVASGERVFEILDEPEEIVERPDARAAPGRRRRAPLRAT